MASAIAFTAVLGIAVIVGLPSLIPLLHLSDTQYGVVAGLTVYAVPQVIAAAYPVSVAAGQAATLVKLMRVLLLGPVVLMLSLTEHHAAHLRWWRAVPWYIIGFAVTSTLRTLDVIPADMGDLVREGARALTVMAMAGLGLAVDLEAVRRVGASVGATVLISTPRPPAAAMAKASSSADSRRSLKVPGDWQIRRGRTSAFVALASGPQWDLYDGSLVARAWYQRQTPIPAEWQGRAMEYCDCGVLPRRRMGDRLANPPLVGS